MPPKRKPATPEASLAPIPSEILDQFVHEGPLTSEELDAAVRRFNGPFEPRLIGKHERRFTGFDDKVIALYARAA